MSLSFAVVGYVVLCSAMAIGQTTLYYVSKCVSCPKALSPYLRAFCNYATVRLGVEAL
jgi:hypothetical protein